MKRLIFICLLATSLRAEHNAHCPTLFGIQMPKAEPKMPYAKLTVYFVPAYRKAPKCSVDWGEGQLIDVKPEWVRFAGKPETRLDIRCIEVNQ